MALPATDDFTGANNDPLSANWSQPQGEWFISSNAAFGYGAYPNIAFWNADAFAADQYSEADLGTNAQGAGVGVRLGATNNGYYIQIPSTLDTVVLSRLDAGVATELQSITGLTIAHMDRWRLEVSGSTFKVFQNGTQRGTDSTDSTYVSGSAGITSHGGGSPSIDNFEGGNLGAPPVGSGVSFPRWRSVRR
jgi:hypothetical protein